MAAKPIKLRNGTWGAQVEGEVQTGDTITITTKAGKSWDARVVRVLWTGEGRSIVVTEQQRLRRGRGTWTGCTCGSVEEFEKPTDCWNCRHDR